MTNQEHARKMLELRREWRKAYDEADSRGFVKNLSKLNDAADKFDSYVEDHIVEILKDYLNSTTWSCGCRVIYNKECGLHP